MDTDEITHYLDRLRAGGLLDYLDEARFAEVKQEVLQANPVNAFELLRAIPELVYYFDTEMIYEPSLDYPRLIQKSLILTHGRFVPQNIAAYVAGETDVEIEFDYAGRHFSGALRLEEDWADMEYVGILNFAIERVHGETLGKFCLLNTGGQDTMVVFLTPPQRSLPEINELLPYLEC